MGLDRNMANTSNVLSLVACERQVEPVASFVVLSISVSATAKMLSSF